MNNKNQLLVVLALATTSLQTIPVYADAISPRIKNQGNVYSKEPADTGFYGTGVGGRAVEAMNLRFEVERLLEDGEIDQAVAKGKKACQLDPGDPTCHVLLARALTRKFYATEGPVDEKLLKECLAEWKLIWFHDSDQWEQMEAKQEAKRMMRIAKNLQKKKFEEAKERLAAKQDLEKQKQVASDATSDKNKATAAPPSASTGTTTAARPVPPNKTANNPTRSAETAADAKSEEAISIASKKKRFLLF